MASFTTRCLGPFLATVAVLAPAPAQAQHFPSEEELALLLRYRAEDGAAPAVALGLLDQDGSTSVLTAGDAGPGAAPLGPGSVFELGDLTMTFTATLLAVMAERGEVSLDDPVARYLPESVQLPSVGGREITLVDLARHRSGLPADAPEPQDAFTVEDLYDVVSRAKLEYPPGQEHEFSHIGYGLLGHALARSAGLRFPDLLRSRVLEPLGMEHTGFALEGEIEDRMVRGHARGEVVPFEMPTEALQGATGLRSTPTDMLAYLEANARPPDTELGRAMRLAQQVPGSDPTGEGRGFSWRRYAGGGGREPLLVTHGGRTGGFTSLITLDRERGIGTVFLASSSDTRPWVSRNLLWLDPWPSEPAHHVDPTIAGRYAGTYSTTVGRYTAVPDAGRYFIRLEEEGRLTYQRPGGVRVPLQPRTDSTFYMVGVPYTLSFHEQGDRMRFIASLDEREPPRQRGQRWVAWRVNEETPPLDEASAPSASFRIALMLLLAGVAVAVARSLWRRRRRA